MTRSSVIVFVGPSLPTAIRPADPRFDWRPPAQAGDMLRLLDDGPRTICLIDGYFDARPAPWHKEILVLIEIGARVLGAASMGALRAAELDRHGMIGVGAIYRAYREGRITGDDEVAVTHAPGELGWTALTDAMIEVRASLAAAARAKIVSVETAHELRAAARSLHFSERTWPGILAAVRWRDAAASSLLAWLEGNAVHLKQRDALRCLDEASSGEFSHRAVHATPRTCFISDLANECGVALPRFSRHSRRPVGGAPAP